jgi:hypothetical protein
MMNEGQECSLMTMSETLAGAKRIVVKVGSSSISGEREHQVTGLVDALAAWRACSGARMPPIATTGAPARRHHQPLLVVDLSP